VGGKVGGRGGDYTEEERRVLAATTTVNAREYLPFIAADLRFSKIHNIREQKESISTYGSPNNFV
jgi:hypothetical protein